MKRISLVAFGLALSMAYAHGSGWSENKWYGEANRDPQWSPDGAKLAFVSYRDYNAELYVMNADGSGLTRLTSGGARSFSFSPMRVNGVLYDTYGHIIKE